MTLFSIMKWLHILSAIAALGSNLTYNAWLGLARGQPDSLVFALKGIRSIDNKIANRGYGALLVTGVIMVLVADFPWSAPWLLTSIILYVATSVLGIAVYSPSLRRQIELAESEGPESAAYQAAAQSSTRLGIVVTLIVVVIVFLMVVKPNLWG